MSSESGFREFLRSRNGKVAVALLIVAAFAVMGWSIWSNVTPSASGSAAENIIFVSAGSGESFHVKLANGMRIPVESPNGKVDGYPAELCYWTKDGGTKTEPTAVLLNELVGKPGPTYCPDCGRLVIHHNPAPGPGVKAPPLKGAFGSFRAP